MLAGIGPYVSARRSTRDVYLSPGGSPMSIVRIGLGETDKFGEGYDAIFGKKKITRPKKAKAAARKSMKKSRKKAAKK